VFGHSVNCRRRFKDYMRMASSCEGFRGSGDLPFYRVRGLHTRLNYKAKPRCFWHEAIVDKQSMRRFRASYRVTMKKGRTARTARPKLLKKPEALCAF
jgi:hypothetical protein